MGMIQRRLADLGFALPAPLSLPPGIVLPFPWVRVVGTRAIFSGHGTKGAHARSAVGMAELPFDIPVEIEGEVELLPD